MRTKNAFWRALGAFGLIVIAASIAACGGGGGGSSSSTTSGSSSGSSGSSGSSSSSAVSNQATVNVASGAINMLTVSVTICAPGTSTCQTIDNVQVDTMSFGLRLVSSAASQVLGSLAVETDSSGNQIAECQKFADGTFTWGSVRNADVKVGGETASNIPVHILGDMSSARPSGCSGTRDGDSVSVLGVNGILGIGVKPYDCGSNCVSASGNGFYFACPGGTSCSGTTATLAQQVVNPVAKFASDNTGVILTMPAVGTSGASSASGTLTFGVGTQTNNAKPPTVTTFGTDSSGNVKAISTFFSATGNAFFDSGSNGYFFDDSSLTSTECLNSQWYCPSQTTTRVVTISNASGSTQSGTVTMSFGNAQTLFNTGNIAFNNVAGPFNNADIADFGMPFFYGRTVYYGYDLTALGGTQSPYVAF
jgi:hypothetical protein